MIKSTASHGGVAIISLIFGPVMTELIQPAFPGLYRFFESISLGISDLMNSIFGIHTHPAAFISFFFTLLIGIVWGMFYGLARHRTNPSYGQR